MGHQVEYVIDIPPARAREWLSRLPGWWSEPDVAGEMPYSELQWGDLSLHAHLGPAACQICVPQIKYSALINRHATSIELIARLEEWLSETLPDVRAVRVDELLRFAWESQFSRQWWQWLDPVRALCDWLLSSGQESAHFRLLPDEQSRAEPVSPAGC